MGKPAICLADTAGGGPSSAAPDRRHGMESVLNATFEVLTFGAVIVLVVLALGIIAGMMGIFNFAHGEFVLLGAYITYLVYSYGLPVWLGMLAAPLVVAAIGFILERLVIRRFYAVPIIAMLGTYALGLIIREGVRSLIGGLYISVPEPIVGSLTVAGPSLSPSARLSPARWWCRCSRFLPISASASSSRVSSRSCLAAPAPSKGRWRGPVWSGC